MAAQRRQGAPQLPATPLRFATCGGTSMQGETIPAKRFARLSSALRASLGLVLDVALPQLCPTCREPVDGVGLCPACWSKLSFIAPPYCERLGIPFPFDGGPGLLRAQARPCLEIRRPARPRPGHGTLDGACRPRAACRHRRHRCGAAALAAAMG